MFIPSFHLRPYFIFGGDMDMIDRAQAHEDIFHREALHRRQYSREVDRAEEEALYIGGRRRCLDCEETISEARLRANPGAVRCVPCQGEKEKRRYR
jgi:DnaK suppressor protein